MNPAAHSPTIWRVALLLCIISAVVWLGAVNSSALIGNDMLKIGTREIEESLAPEAEREIYRLLSFTALVAIVSYLVTLVSSIVFLVSSPFRLKEHGWLMISAILFYLFVPVEAFTMYLDARMVYLEFFTTAGNEPLRELFVSRVAALAGTPLIALLCYYTIIGLAVFQPLKRPRASTS
jgi:hypothetical protein